MPFIEKYFNWLSLAFSEPIWKSSDVPALPAVVMVRPSRSLVSHSASRVKEMPRLVKSTALPAVAATDWLVLSAIRSMGAKTKLHICGNTTPFLEYLPVEYCDIIDLDWMVPLDRAAEIVQGRCALGGNYDPVAVLLQGTPEDVRAAVTACSRMGAQRYISAAGCEVPKTTPEENFLAVANTLRLI